jgi:hypothetical protein
MNFSKTDSSSPDNLYNLRINKLKSWMWCTIYTESLQMKINSNSTFCLYNAAYTPPPQISVMKITHHSVNAIYRHNCLFWDLYTTKKYTVSAEPSNSEC